MSRLMYPAARASARDILDALSDAASGLRIARDALLTIRRDENPLDFDAEHLQDLIDQADEEIERYNDIVNDAFEDEINDLIRELERAV